MFPLEDFLQDTADGKRARNVTNYVQTESGVWLPMRGSDNGKTQAEVHGDQGLRLKQTEDGELIVVQAGGGVGGSAPAQSGVEVTSLGVDQQISPGGELVVDTFDVSAAGAKAVQYAIGFQSGGDVPSSEFQVVSGTNLDRAVQWFLEPDPAFVPPSPEGYFSKATDLLFVVGPNVEFKVFNTSNSRTIRIRSAVRKIYR
jgi:hypothetical protein